MPNKICTFFHYLTMLIYYVTKNRNVPDIIMLILQKSLKLKHLFELGGHLPIVENALMLNYIF